MRICCTEVEIVWGLPVSCTLRHKAMTTWMGSRAGTSWHGLEARTTERQAESLGSDVKA